MNCCACTSGADSATAATTAAPTSFETMRDILPKPAAKLGGRGAEVNPAMPNGRVAANEYSRPQRRHSWAVAWQSLGTGNHAVPRVLSDPRNRPNRGRSHPGERYKCPSIVPLDYPWEYPWEQPFSSA